MSAWPRTCRTDMDMQYEHEYAAWTWTLDKYLLQVQVDAYAACPSTLHVRMSKFMSVLHVRSCWMLMSCMSLCYAAFPCPCYMPMSML
jgi:hypothetical protein